LTTSQKVAICGPREIRMVEGNTRTERRKCVACWSSFLLHGVHRFKLPQLSDMSNRLFVAVNTQQLNELNLLNVIAVI
jgi:hypothetical protein